MRKAVSASSISTSALIPSNLDKTPKPRSSWMVVDDDEAPLQFLANSPEVFDLADIHQFRSPAEALSTFAAAPDRFELVITDLNMPGMSGIQLCRRLLQLSPGVKVILTSADPIDNQRVATEAGFSAFLSKPFPPSALWRILESVLGGLSTPRGPRLMDLYL